MDDNCSPNIQEYDRRSYDPPESAPWYGELGEAICYGPDSRDEWKERGIADRAAWVAAMPQHLTELHDRAKQALPPGTVHELRGKVPTNYGRDVGVAWYHLPEMKDWEVTGAVPWPGEFHRLGGYFKLGTFRTPHT